MRFVDKWNDIREESKEFGKSTQVNGEATFNEFLQIIKKADLEIINLRSATELVICLLKRQSIFICVALLGQGV